MQETIEIKKEMKREGIKPFPTREQRIQTIAKEDPRFKDKKKDKEKEIKQLYYDVVYRDFSALAHFSYLTVSGIGAFTEKSPFFSFSDSEITKKCLTVTAGFFMQIVEIWNNTFHLIETEQLDQWFDEWIAVRNRMKGR